MKKVKVSEIYRDTPLELFEFYQEIYHLHHTWTWPSGKKHVTEERETPLTIACTDFVHTRDGRAGCLVTVAHKGESKSFVIDTAGEWAKAYDHFIEVADKFYKMESEKTPLEVWGPSPTGVTTNRDARDMGDPTLAD